MNRSRVARLLASALLCGGLLVALPGCGSQPAEAPQPAEEQPAEETAGTRELADGTYDIEVETDSSMFRAESCVLTVADGAYTVALSLPGEGFSRLYWGTAEEAATADDADIYDYYLNDEGLYTFDLPVASLDEELPIAAFGHRRDTWYDHLITFHAPAEGMADAA